jgi:hypothetical protein
MYISYTNVTRFIKPIFPFLHLKHLKSLILIVYGIMHSQSLEYAQIARHTMTDTSHHHTKKRIYRFIDNVDIDLGLLMVYWCRFVVCVFCCLGCYVPVIVDITWVNGHKYLVAAIPFCFRAIPVAFRRFTDEEIRRCSSQNQIENDFFSWLRMTLWDYNVVIIADRGFRRTSLLQFLRGLGLDYVIRVCGNVYVSTGKNARDKYCGVLGNIKLKSGERRYLRNALYHKTLQVPVHLVLGKLKAEKGKKIEPWYIATSLSDLDKAYELYRKRFWIEEMFRDFKSRFHWCQYKVKTNRRREMLTFCLMVSYTMVAFLGYQVEKTGRAPIVSSYGKSSITWLGIGVINHRKESASSLFRQIRRRLSRTTYKMAA